MRIILASGSPRRRELLGEIGVEFEVRKAVGEEKTSATSPKEMVKELAEQKAQEVRRTIQDEDALIIAADTVVAMDHQVLGKPKDEMQARKMMEMLSGRTHQVYTGVVCLYQEQRVCFAEKTEVSLYKMTKDEIEEYIKTSSPYDKAGGYGIQESFGMKYICGIQGDYYNVVGLPVARLYQELKTIGIDL
ncbi:Maf family protein [Eubacterium oxidoreducens]|uniref:dTTP/UTP pyrophosphatase n=1 Tax=Eubacterium oxidoreducens TaxID=1732 RepID=A0A1G6BM91_EUBOX|nr:Maf family protein [Eubacterium oxidoreducens]SDB21741.1 septum formation protein [Eubacterium oxidoreducens]